MSAWSSCTGPCSNRPRRPCDWSCRKLAEDDVVGLPRRFTVDQLVARFPGTGFADQGFDGSIGHRLRHHGKQRPNQRQPGKDAGEPGAGADAPQETSLLARFQNLGPVVTQIPCDFRQLERGFTKLRVDSRAQPGAKTVFRRIGLQVGLFSIRRVEVKRFRAFHVTGV